MSYIRLSSESEPNSHSYPYNISARASLLSGDALILLTYLYLRCGDAYSKFTSSRSVSSYLPTHRDPSLREVWGGIGSPSRLYTRSILTRLSIRLSGRDSYPLGLGHAHAQSINPRTSRLAADEADAHHRYHPGIHRNRNNNSSP